jgi:misacylated tRNA(Ala) deacylase
MVPNLCVVLTIYRLFAEGGGQPADNGWINRVEVFDVQRAEDGTIVHYARQSVSVGSVVIVEVDWIRRFDHMQQHSGQHLVSAVAWNAKQMKTVSWKLSKFPAPCYVDLCGEFSAEDLKDIEKRVNAKIVSAAQMKVHLFKSADDLSASGRSVKDGMLEHHDFSKSVLRVMEIEGEDFNACCGTHVSNTSQLQMVKFVGTEKVKGNLRLYFCVGDRCSAYFDQLFEVTSKLGTLLNTGTESLVGSVERLKTEHKQTRKDLQTLLSDLSQLEGEKLLALQEKEHRNFIVYQKPGFDLTLLRNVTKLVESKYPECLIVCFGDDQFLVSGGIGIGKDNLVSIVGKDICSTLNGKGGGGKGRPYQGKFPKENYSEAILSKFNEFLHSQF